MRLTQRVVQRLAAHRAPTAAVAAELQAAAAVSLQPRRVSRLLHIMLVALADRRTTHGSAWHDTHIVPTPHIPQASALSLARPLRQRRRASPQPPSAHFISAGGDGGEAAYGEVVGSGEFSGSLGSGSGSGSRAAARQEGWQRRWGMVAMCFVAFMVSTQRGILGAGLTRLRACMGGEQVNSLRLLLLPTLSCSRNPTSSSPLPPARSCATWTA